MSREDVTRKALGLLVPVLGQTAAQDLADVLWNLEKLENVRELRRYLRSA
jgi:hypothetical protein